MARPLFWTVNDPQNTKVHTAWTHSSTVQLLLLLLLLLLLFYVEEFIKKKSNKIKIRILPQSVAKLTSAAK